MYKCFKKHGLIQATTGITDEPPISEVDFEVFPIPFQWNSPLIHNGIAECLQQNVKSEKASYCMHSLCGRWCRSSFCFTVANTLTTEEVRHASRNADSACPFCIGAKGTLSQHFVTHVVPSLPSPDHIVLCRLVV